MSKVGVGETQNFCGDYRICQSPCFEATVHTINGFKALLCNHLGRLLAAYAVVAHDNHWDIFGRLVDKRCKVVVVQLRCVRHVSISKRLRIANIHNGYVTLKVCNVVYANV